MEAFRRLKEKLKNQLCSILPAMVKCYCMQKENLQLLNMKCWKILSVFSWIKFKILTGRTHQIRVHAQFIGHSIVCDELYGDGKPVLLSSLKKKYNLSKREMEEKPILSRLALHSASLKFIFK